MSIRRKLISDVRSMHKLLSTDSLITDRVIWSELFSQASLLMKRETNLRRLWATDTIFTTIPCMPMVQVPVSECCSYVDECTVARSKDKLPKISEGSYQYVIQGVYSINAMGGKGTKFDETTVNRFINTFKLPLIKNKSYFWISNDYLYISNPLIASVRLVAYFEEDIPNEILYPECDCGSKASLEDICKNPLDLDSHIPGYLEKQVLAETRNSLLQSYFNIKTDMANDGIDGQAPNSPNLK